MEEVIMIYTVNYRFGGSGELDSFEPTASYKKAEEDANSFKASEKIDLVYISNNENADKIFFKGNENDLK